MDALTARPCSVRWSIRRDMAEVLAVERATFGAWDEAGFFRRLQAKNCVMVVAAQDFDGAVAGFAVYELLAYYLRVVNMAARTPEARAALVQKLSAASRVAGRVLVWGE